MIDTVPDHGDTPQLAAQVVQARAEGVDLVGPDHHLTGTQSRREAPSRLGLYRAATRIGRGHVASAVNTIVLAYAGASLPLLLLITAGNQDISDLLASEFLAQEIVRSAVGTIGLVASAPITTALATLVADLREPNALAGRHAPTDQPSRPGRGLQDHGVLSRGAAYKPGRGGGS